MLGTCSRIQARNGNGATGRGESPARLPAPVKPLRLAAGESPILSDRAVPTRRRYAFRAGDFLREARSTLRLLYLRLTHRLQVV
jgi:hypothetical protein